MSSAVATGVVLGAPVSGRGAIGVGAALGGGAPVVVVVVRVAGGVAGPGVAPDVLTFDAPVLGVAGAGVGAAAVAGHREP